MFLKNSGLSLIETLVSVFIISAVIIGYTALISQYANSLVLLEDKFNANLVANNQLVEYEYNREQLTSIDNTIDDRETSIKTGKEKQGNKEYIWEIEIKPTLNSNIVAVQVQIFKNLNEGKKGRKVLSYVSFFKQK